MEIHPTTIALLIVVSFTAYFIKGLVGFGPSLIMIPVLSWLVDFKSAVAIATLADFVSNIFIMYKKHHLIDWRVYRRMLLGLIIGTFIGVLLLNVLTTDWLKRIYGFFLILMVAKGYLERREHKVIAPEKVTALRSTIFGFFGGLIGGLTNTNGPIIILYFRKIFKNLEVMRINLAAIFLTDSLWRGALIWTTGIMTIQHLELFVVAILPALVLGIVVSRKISHEAFQSFLQKLTELLLFVFGCGLMFK